MLEMNRKKIRISMRIADFSGGKKLKKVENTVGESKSTKLSN